MPFFRRHFVLSTTVRALLQASAVVFLAVCARAQDSTGGDEPAPAATGITTQNGDELTRKYLLREKGLRALDDQILAAAERFFRDYRETVGTAEPDFTDATILLVRTLLQRGEGETAQHILDDHHERSTGELPRYFERGIRYWSAKTAFAGNDWEAALERIEPLLNTEETADDDFRARALELAGAARVALGDIAKARTLLKALIDEHPNGERARQAKLGLLRTYLADNEIELAEEMLAALRSAYEEQVPPRVQLYALMLELGKGNAEEAFERYDRLEGEIPARSDADWWFALSRLSARLMAAEKYRKALDVLPHEAATALDEKTRNHAELRQVDCLIALEETELAINALTAFRDKYPDSPHVVPVFFKLAQLLRSTGNPLSAAEYFQKVVEAEEVSPERRYEAAYQRAWCFSDADDHRSARDAFSAAARLGRTDKQQAEAFLMAGDAAFHLAEYTKAALSYQAIADNFSGTPFAETARFRQGRARFKAELYGNAALVYKQFLDEFPESDSRETAWLERGIALKRAGESEKAIITLTEFATAFPDSERRLRALLEAGLSAAVLQEVDRAVTLLTQVIEEADDGPDLAHALYQRCRIRFATARYEKAIRDAWAFIERYGHLPMAADVYFWLGDHYANEGDIQEAERYFRELYTKQPKAELAPQALYEAAHLRFRQDNPDGALDLLRELRTQFAEIPSRLEVDVEILHGDVLAANGAFVDALAHFRAAHLAAPETADGLAAAGRCGDMLLALERDDANKSLEKAVEYFDLVASTETVPPPQRERAIYRKAKAYEKMGNTDAAIAEYLDIVYRYDIDLTEGKVRDWFYFARAGYDAARLLTLQEKHRLAARTYERIAASKIPLASEAAARAREIREKHEL